MSGVCLRRILPTICVHIWSVASVSCHSARTSSGQVSPFMMRNNTPTATALLVSFVSCLDARLRRGYYCVVKFRLIVEKDTETGRYSSVFPELPGCGSAGDTEEEAIANAKEALELWFEPTDLPLDESARLVEVTV